MTYFLTESEISNNPNVEVGPRGKKQYGECQAIAEREMARAVRRD